MVLGYPTPLGQDVEASSDVEEELRDRVQIVVATGVGSEDGEVEEDDEDQEGHDEDGVLHHGGDVRATQGNRSRLCVFSGRQMLDNMMLRAFLIVQKISFFQTFSVLSEDVLLELILMLFAKTIMIPHLVTKWLCKQD